MARVVPRAGSETSRKVSCHRSIGLPMTCSGMANLVPRNGALAGGEAGLPPHLSAAG